MSVTGVQSLYYVGHSEGSNIGLATFSSNPTLAQHISEFSPTLLADSNR